MTGVPLPRDFLIETAEDGRLRSAIDIVARQVLHNLVEEHAGELWGDSYPEVGEYDWERIEQRLRHFSRAPAGDMFKLSYQILEERGEEEWP